MLYFLFGRQPAPQLTVGKPFDPSADVPLFPPAALLLTMLTARALWAVSGKRFSFVPAPLSALAARMAILAAGLAFTKLYVLDQANGTLEAAGSGALFTPVEGLATEGIYATTRNPMYCGLIFFALPTLSVVVNSGWPILVGPITWAYLNYIVIAAEEALLTQAFGAQYAAYCEKVPRWLI